MQTPRKPSFMKSVLGAKQPAKSKQGERKAPTPLDEQQLRQVSGGETINPNLPRGTW